MFQIDPPPAAGILTVFGFALHENWNGGNTFGEPGQGSSALYTDDPDWMAGWATGTILNVYDCTSGGDHESRNLTSDWASANQIRGVAKIGSYFYVCLADGITPENRVYRYAVGDLASGGTQMTETLGNTAVVDRMCSDGTNLYFNSDGGDTASSRHIWEKFTISGTTLTSAGKTTCGSTDTYFGNSLIDESGNFYGYDVSNRLIRRYDTSGTLQATQSTAFNSTDGPNMHTHINGGLYITRHDTTTDMFSYTKIPLLA
jgi:hypothetical protein